MTRSTRRGYWMATSPTGFPRDRSSANTGPYSRNDSNVLQRPAYDRSPIGSSIGPRASYLRFSSSIGRVGSRLIMSTPFRRSIHGKKTPVGENPHGGRSYTSRFLSAVSRLLSRRINMRMYAATLMPSISAFSKAMRRVSGSTRSGRDSVFFMA